MMSTVKWINDLMFEKMHGEIYISSYKWENVLKMGDKLHRDDLYINHNYCEKVVKLFLILLIKDLVWSQRFLI